MKILGRRGAYVKFPLWWGYGYFLELHIVKNTRIPVWANNLNGYVRDPCCKIPQGIKPSTGLTMFYVAPSSALSVLIAGGVSFTTGLLSTWSFISSALFLALTFVLSSGFFTKALGFFWVGRGFLGGITGL